MTLHRLLIAPFLLSAAVLLPAACGGDEKAPSPTATPGTSAGTPAAPVGAATPSPPAAPPTPASPATPSAPAAPELELPDGFAAFLAVDDLSSPTSLAVDGEGRLYVSEEGGVVWRLRDEDGDGAFEARDRFVEVARRITGIALAPDGALYVSHTGRVTAARDLDGDGEAEDVREIASGLPNGAHQNNGLTLGPDGLLYLTNGSTCNDCQESDPRSATILRMNADGSGLEVFAGGLRNPYDLTFTPDGRLWSTDNGSDPPCNTVDEVNLIVEGGDYGWPYGPGCDSFADGTAPVAGLGFNTASTGITYYDASAFPPEYRGNFFVTLWGDLGFTPERAGRVLVRVALDESGDRPEGRVEDFGRGFENPIDVVVDRDGSLLVADYGSGRVYRIVYVGG
jgi:putative membrane-bound dehydrogenase-like protein